MEKNGVSVRRSHNPPDAPEPVGGYSQGVEVGGERFVFVSGQVPESVEGETPLGFEEQCELVWFNLREVLRSAGMTFDDLVKVTTFLTSKDQAEANSEIRQRMLGDARPALTVVVAQTLESQWLLEIEAVAAA